MKKTRRRYDRDFKISVIAELEGGKTSAEGPDSRDRSGIFWLWISEDNSRTPEPRICG